MNEELFYIEIHNRKYKREFGNDDYHIERIFEKDDIKEILESLTKDAYSFSDYSLIVTNDNALLFNYIFAINEEELKMLCKYSDFDKKQIRINKDYFDSISSEVHEYFQKIKANQIISATMHWSSETIYGGYDHDPTIGIISESFERWVENKEFLYFKTPHRYLNSEKTNKIFCFDDIKKANLPTLNELLNINILQIGKDDNYPKINWELRKGILRYYDKISCKRLYISQKYLDSLSKNNELVFTIDTQLDANHYIEYYVTGIENSKEEDIEFDSQRNFDDSHQPKYDRYNGVYGLDDNTIDSAFEGDPENYWNIN